MLNVNSTAAAIAEHGGPILMEKTLGPANQSV
jgi:hypothetical protein